MLDGYVKLFRQSMESRVFKNAELWKVWTWCLMKANHKEKWVTIQTGRGLTEIKISPGQFIFGRKTASEELLMPESSIRNRMKKLKNMQNLDMQPDTHYSIITIINWNTYQVNEKKEDRQEDNQRTGKGQPKDTNKNVKNVKKLFSQNSNEYRLALYLFNHIAKRNPKHRQPDIQKWAKQIDYMIRLDLRDPTEVKEVIKWCQADTGNGKWSGWQNNILSTATLRDKYDTLLLKMGKSTNNQFGTCSKCRAPNIDLTDQGICLDCHRGQK